MQLCVIYGWVFLNGMLPVRHPKEMPSFASQDQVGDHSPLKPTRTEGSHPHPSHPKVGAASEKSQGGFFASPKPAEKQMEGKIPPLNS